ncbi:hypothetical protein AVEN_48429-1 [Araneus ventricosus]|uniref:Uncharacterized protein n=1 Tax=Araneus ventricosus TaxID=182803 RepID=A0A4Y2RNA0_ARAVE|nr:hypothetical protein AVEN_48429-1 [Araneus ventricosus]
MDQHYYRSASNNLLARTADRTPKTFELQGDPSRPTLPPSSKRSPYIVSPADRDVTWNDLAHSWRISSPNRDTVKIPAPLRSHISSPRWSPRSVEVMPGNRSCQEPCPVCGARRQNASRADNPSRGTSSFICFCLTPERNKWSLDFQVFSDSLHRPNVCLRASNWKDEIARAKSGLWDWIQEELSCAWNAQAHFLYSDEPWLPELAAEF